MAHRISDRRLPLIAGVLLATVMAPSLASAQTANCNSADHQRGRQLREQHQDQQAYELFRDLFQREQSACAQARMGLALRALGRWVEALDAVEGAMARTSDPWLGSARAQLEREAAEIRSHVGLVEIVAEPAVSGAELWVNGARAATLPLSQPVRLSAGAAIIEVRASGYRTVQRSLEVSGGQRSREVVPMVRDLSASSGSGNSGSGNVSSSGGTTGNGPTPPTTGGAQQGGRSMGPAIAAFGIGGAFAIGGGVLWGVSAMNYNTYLQCGGDTRAPEDVCPETRRSASLFRQLGIVGIGVGAAGIIAGVVLMVAGPRSANSDRTTGLLQCVPSLMNPGVECGGRF